MFAKKSLGQHFLMHRATAERIADASGITPADTALEIGPGTGILTTALLQRAGKVIAVEADHELVPKLQETFRADITSGKLVLVESDIRSFDPKSIAGDYHVVANIPYYITGEIIRSFLTATHKPRSMTLLVQKEVAERIVRSKKESLLSLSVKVYGTPVYRFTVPKGAFIPAPKVDSAVLSITDINQHTFIDDVAEHRFFEILRAGFAHKRKRLAKNLEDVAPTASVTAAFETLALSPNARPEDVSLQAWRTLANHI
jgi:16S rRNA (adenine1518-N6/adenine1519-N6)-dimethyltransferase